MPRLVLLLMLAMLAGLVVYATPKRTTPTIPEKKVRLGVIVVFDQMRGDFVQKWQPYFGRGGFARLQSAGAWYPQCYYPYGNTSTGPGHSAILSGATLDGTGIVNNEWYDRAEAAQVYCAGSDRYQLVPAPKPDDLPRSTVTSTQAETKKKPKAVGNPDRMLAETLGDVVKRETKGKVFGLSLKDRSAILPTGKRPDGAFWFNGQFTTSTYYTDAAPEWVTAFNASGAAEQFFKQTWKRFRPDLDYDAIVGPDDVVGESILNGRTRTFPHTMTGGKDTIGKNYYEALANSPFGNELLLAFAKSCILFEKLGQDDEPDLLVLSFSSNDLIGHTFGPDSHEVFDTTLRSDAIMADLLTFLDGAVGEGRYALTVTADHGVCPLPEFAATHGHPEAKRVPINPIYLDAEKYLQATFGAPPKITPETLPDGTTAKAKPLQWIEANAFPWVYLNHRLLNAKGLKVDTVADSLAAWYRGRKEFETAYTASSLRGPSPANDSYFASVQRSFLSERCGDVYIVLKPYCLTSDPISGTGTSHGTPHEYDQHVPMMILGPGISTGRHEESTTPQQHAAILAQFLGVSTPKNATYRAPTTLFQK